MRASGLIIPNNFAGVINSLTNERAGQLVKLLLQYREEGLREGVLLEQIDPEIRYVYLAMTAFVDEANRRYENRCARNKYNAQKRWLEKKEEETKSAAEEQVKPVEKKPQVKKEVVDFSEDFEVFWKQYPRKIDKQRAKRRYGEIRKKVSGKTIEEGLRRYLNYIRDNNTEMQFIKHPTSWLNGMCWENSYGEEKLMGESMCETSVIQQLEKEFEVQYGG